MLARTIIRSVAESFWSTAGSRAAYGSPVRLAEAVTRTLPIAITYVAGLKTTHVASLLTRAGISIPMHGVSRTLRGCLVADLGVGFMLVDSEDPADEQRLTIAHETAHFLLHYRALRAAVLAGLGQHLIAVLDRTRTPTSAELLSSALRNLPLEPFRHAMLRNGTQPRGRTATMEAEADDLAIELVAPWNLVRALDTRNAETIAMEFGIPLTVAARLASMARRPTTEVGVAGIFEVR